MARIRTIKPEFWTDPKIGKLKRDERLLFIGLLNLADDQGVLMSDPMFIKAQLFGYDKDLRESAVEAWLASLQNARLIVPFVNGTEGYYVIRSFRKHQVINKPSKPKFPEELIQSVLEGEHSRSTPVVVTEHSRQELGSRNREGEKEGNTSLAKNFQNFSPDAIAFSAWFEKLLPETQKITEADRRNWKQTYDDLIRLDKRDKPTISKVVQWARSDPFWSPNFLSATKLRKKDSNGISYFDVFLNKMTSNNANINGVQGNQRGPTNPQNGGDPHAKQRRIGEIFGLPPNAAVGNSSLALDTHSQS